MCDKCKSTEIIATTGWIYVVWNRKKLEKNNGIKDIKAANDKTNWWHKWYSSCVHFHVQIAMRKIYENQPNTKRLWNRWHVNNNFNIFPVHILFVSHSNIENRNPYNIMICDVFSYFSASFIIYSFMSHSIEQSWS